MLQECSPTLNAFTNFLLYRGINHFKEEHARLKRYLAQNYQFGSQNATTSQNIDGCQDTFIAMGLEEGPGPSTSALIPPSSIVGIGSPSSKAGGNSSDDMGNLKFATLTPQT